MLRSVGLGLSGVTAGSYTNANITVDANGIITVASNGSGGGGGSPGGPNTSIQFNNSGTFDGFGTWDGSILSLPSGSNKTIKLANSGSGNGNLLTIAGANGFTGGFAGGGLTLTTGNASARTTAGTGTAGGNTTYTLGAGGDALIAGTNNTGGTGGSLSFLGGAGGQGGGATSSFNRGGTGGSLNLTSGKGGDAQATTTSSGFNFGGSGGAFSVTGGQGGDGTNGPSKGGSGGALVFSSGNAGAAGTGKSGGNSGSITFQTGVASGATDGTAGSAGGFLFTAGAAGSANNTGGSSFGGMGGSLSFTASAGGDADTAGGDSTSGDGGHLDFIAGNAGSVTGSGTMTGGVAGAINFTSGNGAIVPSGATGSDGGNVNFTAGNGTGTSGFSNNGGSIYLLPGSRSPSGGTDGNIYLGANSSGTVRGNVYANALINATNSSQVDIINSRLIDASNNLNFDWTAKELLNGGSASVSWGAFQLFDSSTLAYDWGSRSFYAADGTTRLMDLTNSGTSGANYYFFGGKIVGDGSMLTSVPSSVIVGQPVGSSSANELLYIDGANNLANAGSFDGTTLAVSAFVGDGSGLTGIANAHNLTDLSSVLSANGVNRQLFRNDGTTLTVDWQDMNLWYPGAGSPILNWSNSGTPGANYYFAGGVLQGDGSGLTNITPANIAGYPATSSVYLSGDGSWSTPAFSTILSTASITPIADGTYTVGLGLTTNGTITTVSGIITAITQAS